VAHGKCHPARTNAASIVSTKRDRRVSLISAAVNFMTYDNKNFAFPCTGEGYTSPDYTQKGMTLRDYFAAGIAQGMAAHSGTTCHGFGPGDIAKRAYEVADAMLAARASA